jgi:hypothetical protein
MRPSDRRKANRLAKEMLRQEEIRRQARRRKTVLAGRAADRRALKTNLRRRFFGV